MKKCLICATIIQSDTTLICNNCTEEIKKIKGNKRIKYWKKLGLLKNSNKMTFKDQVKECDLLEKTYSSKVQKELYEKFRTNN